MSTWSTSSSASFAQHTNTHTQSRVYMAKLPCSFRWASGSPFASKPPARHPRRRPSTYTTCQWVAGFSKIRELRAKTTSEHQHGNCRYRILSRLAVCFSPGWGRVCCGGGLFRCLMYASPPPLKTLTGAPPRTMRIHRMCVGGGECLRLCVQSQRNCRQPRKDPKKTLPRTPPLPSPVFQARGRKEDVRAQIKENGVN